MSESTYTVDRHEAISLPKGEMIRSSAELSTELAKPRRGALVLDVGCAGNSSRQANISLDLEAGDVYLATDKIGSHLLDLGDNIINPQARVLLYPFLSNELPQVSPDLTLMIAPKPSETWNTLSSTLEKQTQLSPVLIIFDTSSQQRNEVNQSLSACFQGLKRLGYEVDVEKGLTSDDYSTLLEEVLPHHVGTITSEVIKDGEPIAALLAFPPEN